MPPSDIYPSTHLLPPFELHPSPMISSTSRSRRRPHCPQQDCPIQSQSKGINSLPWISLLDISPEQLQLQDIADLSQLPVDQPRYEYASSAGPVRRRKTSFRSSPLRHAAGSTSSYHRDRSPAPSVSLPLRDPSNSPPSTPRPRTSRSRTIFHDLMPVFTHDVRKHHSVNVSPPTP
ncbi:hypothetical protein VKT23_004107 [Stygiomarasmius scandens]|uniref:Uncharacterized protein n=1 Tax=Marasmiellus scandens TaxID=2682957 RepID=A0ABR1JWB5_9AGAR